MSYEGYALPSEIAFFANLNKLVHSQLLGGNTLESGFCFVPILVVNLGLTVRQNDDPYCATQAARLSGPSQQPGWSDMKFSPVLGPVV